MIQKEIDEEDAQAHNTISFVQVGIDVAAIIGSTYPGLIFGGRNSVKLWFYTSAFSYKFSISSGQTVIQFPSCTKPQTVAIVKNAHPKLK